MRKLSSIAARMNLIYSCMEFIILKSKSFIIIVLFSSMMNAHAEQVHGPNCKKPETTLDMHMCADQEVKKKMKELEEINNRLAKKVSIEGKVQLSLAHQSWRSYIKEQCEFEVMGYKTGSIYPVIFLGCYLKLIDYQIKLMKHQLNCKEGDMSCGFQ